MAFRALLSSQKSETSAAVAALCKSAGIRADVCSDIFSAIEKGKTVAFSCVIVDWADQPEASFLLRRARESGTNAETVAIAIVDRQPTEAEIRDNRLDFLIQRPISPEAAQAVLTQAREKMRPAAVEDREAPAEADASPNPAPAIAAPAERLKSAQLNSTQLNAAQVNSAQHEPAPHPQTKPAAFQPPPAPAAHSQETAADETVSEPEQKPPRVYDKGQAIRIALAAMLVLAAAFSLWSSRDTVEYLSQTHEGRFHVLRESVAAFFYLNHEAAAPVSSAGSDAQQDAYFSRSSGTASAPAPSLKVVTPESTITEAHISLSKASDFPQPTPALEHQDQPPIHRQQLVVPDSMKDSAPIPQPEVVTVNAAQMTTASTPQPSPAIQQFREPVAVSEETARALLTHPVNPAYPPEALAQKLHGTVVLQVTVARDGSVEDVKMVRGYFLLAQAAIAAVKQWRFDPYTLKGQAAAIQTTITINFNFPPG